MIDFPASPINGQEFTSANVTYIWNGQGWVVKPFEGSVPIDGYTKAESDTRFVNVVGDTVNGELIFKNFSTKNVGIVLDKQHSTAADSAAYIQGKSNGLPRWQMHLGNNSGETGGNVGSDFLLWPSADDGTTLPSAIYISRKTRDVQFSGNISGAVHYFGNPTNWNAGTYLAWSAGPDLSQRFLTFHSDYSYIYYDIYAAGAGAVTVSVNTNGWYRQQGDTAFLHCSDSVYKPSGGMFLASSDVRIKSVENDFTKGLDAILQLRPVHYRYKGNDTPGEPAHTPTGNPSDEGTLRGPVPKLAPYPNSSHRSVVGKRFVGLVAQEVEAVFPELVSKRAGFIDGLPVDDLRDLDTTPLFYALINAVKELSARVVELEAKLSPK